MSPQNQPDNTRWSMYDCHTFVCVYTHAYVAACYAGYYGLHVHLYVYHGESFLLVRVCVRIHGWYTNSKLLIYLCGDAPRVATTVTMYIRGYVSVDEKIPRRSGAKKYPTEVGYGMSGQEACFALWTLIGMKSFN